MPKAFRDKEPICCAVCKRESTGIGYSPSMKAPIAWLCDDCVALGKTVYSMTIKDFNQHEACSLSDAGDKAGEYLEGIGKSDLASLTREEWVTFLKTVLFGFEDAMRSRLKSAAQGSKP